MDSSLKIGAVSGLIAGIVLGIAYTVSASASARARFPLHLFLIIVSLKVGNYDDH